MIQSVSLSICEIVSSVNKKNTQGALFIHVVKYLMKGNFWGEILLSLRSQGHLVIGM